MNGKIIGYIPGVFDLFHHGHSNLIEKSLENCDKLVIGIHTDIFTQSYKRLPDQSQEIRKQHIMKYITENNVEERILAFEFVDNSHLEIVRKYGVNIIFHGDDWEIESYKKQIRYIEDGLDTLHIEIMILKYTIGISSTLIKSRGINFSKIDEVLFDLDNTLSLNQKATYNAVECIKFLQSKNIQLKVITNNNRYSPKQINKSLENVGIFLEEDQIQSSLKQLRNFLQKPEIKEKYKNVFVWGSNNAQQYLSQSGIQLQIMVEKSDLVVFLYTDNFNYNQLTYVLTHISKTNVPYIIGNIDLLYPDTDRILPDTGIIYKIIQMTLPKNTQPLLILGKPSSGIYTPKNTDKCIMVGDNVNTDGEYAKNLNIPFIHLTQQFNIENEKNTTLKIIQISHLGVLIDYFTHF